MTELFKTPKPTRSPYEAGFDEDGSLSRYSQLNVQPLPEGYSDNVRQAYREYHNLPREMTAEDLGLPLALWSEMGEAYWDFAFGRSKTPESPYMFWLGAEADE